MARPRSSGYDGKRRAILRRSAQLFARNGYDRTSMAEVASASGVSKALLYHYYVGKESLLFDILYAHFREISAKNIFVCRHQAFPARALARANRRRA